MVYGNEGATVAKDGLPRQRCTEPNNGISLESESLSAPVFPGIDDSLDAR